MKLVKKIKIKLNKEAKEYLMFASEKCRLIYNFALQERIDLYKSEQKSISCYAQKKKLPSIKEKYPEYKKIYNKCLQAIYFRLDKAFKYFFTKQNKFPKFKRKGIFISQEYPSMYIKVVDEYRFIMPTGRGLNNFILRTSEEIPENFSTVIIKKEKNNYFACFTVDIKENQNCDNGDILAIDLGIKTLCSGISSIGEFVNVRKFKHYYKHLDLLRSKRDRHKKKSRKWNKWNRVLWRELERYKNRTMDYFHKVTYWLSNTRSESTVVVGDLNLEGMIKTKQSWFNRIVQNEWKIGKFVGLLNYKCKLYGKKLVKIDERNTTKMCSSCGSLKSMTLSDRIYKCEKCGFEFDRDYNSAINILKKYLQSVADAEKQKFLEFNSFTKLNNLNIDTFVYI